MSEQLNNPEFIQKRLADDCSGCGERYILDTATVNSSYWFDNNVDCSFAQCTCPNCDYKTIIWIDDFGREALEQCGVNVKDNLADAPDNVKEARQETYERNARQLDGDDEEEDDYDGEQFTVKEYQLTDRHEEMIKRFGETITAITEQAPDLFWDTMNTSPPPQTMPHRWI